MDGQQSRITKYFCTRTVRALPDAEAQGLASLSKNDTYYILVGQMLALKYMFLIRLLLPIR